MVVASFDRAARIVSMSFLTEFVEWHLLRLGLFFIFALAIAITPLGCAPTHRRSSGQPRVFRVFARGEVSYRLPEVRETLPPASDAVRKWVWDRDADDSRYIGELIAVADGMVAFVSNGRVCAFSEASGHQIWCAGNGSGPAYAGHAIAYTAADGSVHAVDAASGIRRWSHVFATSSAAAALSGPAPRISESVWSTGDDFLVARLDGLGGHGAPNYGEISHSGRLLWATELVGGFEPPLIIRPNALQPLIESGAALSVMQQVVRLGPRGGLGAILNQAWEVLDVHWPQAVIAGDWTTEEVQDHFLTFNVERVDLHNGSILDRFHYEPDYNDNYALYTSNAFAGAVEYGFPPHLRADSKTVYAAVGKKLYRYRLASAHSQRPLLVAADAKFLGGPSRGTVYVERRDGVWALRPTARAIEARLVAHSRAPARVMAMPDHVAYFGFEDGHVYGVDVESGRAMLEAKVPCTPDRLSTSLRRVYVVCSSGSRSRIFAFARF